MRPLEAPKEVGMTYRFTMRLLLVEAVPVFVLFCVPFLAHAGMLSALSTMFSVAHTQADVVVPNNAQTTPLLQVAVHSNPNPSKGGGDIMVNEGALVPDVGPGSANGALVLPANGEISVYVVREGDALSQIAEMFGVTADTILWANDLKSANLIKPGDSLIILPVSGVRHVMKAGETMADLARIYAGNVGDIVAYNGLSSEKDVSVGQTVVIPGGTIAPPPAPKKKSQKGHGALVLQQSPVSAGFLVNPVPGAIKTQGIHGYNGIDLGTPTGTTVHAAAAGTVIISKDSGWNGGYGNYIVIKHPNGTQTLYAHLSTNAVGVGQSVSRSQAIGESGSTGQSTGPHLHFEVRGGVNPF